MFTYTKIVEKLYVIAKDGKAYRAVSSLAHAKMFCNNLNK
jgi:hypothetical protein